MGKRGGDLHQCREAEQAVAGAVRRNENAMQVGVFGDPFQLGKAADVGRIGSDDVDGVAFDQRFEVLAEIDLLAEWIGVEVARVTSRMTSALTNGV